MAKFKLGERYVDTVSGREGVLMALQDHMDHGQVGVLTVVDPYDNNKQNPDIRSMARMERVKGQPKPAKSRMAGGKHTVKFGKVYTDIVTGASGKAVSRIEHLTGCERVELLYTDKSTGNEMSLTIDEELLRELPPPKKARERGPAMAFNTVAPVLDSSPRVLDSSPALL
jgi:hypothetical protein